MNPLGLSLTTNPATTKLAAALTIDRAWAIDASYASSVIPGLLEIPGSLNAAYLESQDAQNGSYEVRDGTATIMVSGPMTKADSSVVAIFGGCSTVRTRRALGQAASDDRVERIVLVFDSPGGQVSGTQDFADLVARVGQTKPVVAYIDGMCCSAALWVASQCTEIVANPNALHIGSIGVVTAMYDSSQAFQDAGVTAHLITTGPLKGHPTAGVAIPDEVIEDAQAMVDAICKQFCETVARGRGLDAARVNALATGQTWRADEALERGLVDRLAAYDDLFGGESGGPRAGDNSMSSILSKILGIGGAPPTSASPTTGAIDPNEQIAHLEREVQATYDALAVAFIDRSVAELRGANRLMPAEEGAFKELLGAAIRADGGGKAFARGGEIVAGELTVSALKFAASRPVVSFPEPQLPSAETHPKATVIGDKGEKTESYAEIAARATEKAKKSKVKL